MSDEDLVGSDWGPGFIGFTISIAMYGTAVGQSIFYARSFPKDPIFTKLIVFLLFIADTVHLLGACYFYWVQLISCRRIKTWSCQTQLPPETWLAVPINFLVTFTVQILYCQRIWIISGKKKRVTVPILITAVVQLGLGSWSSALGIQHKTIAYLSSTPLTAYAAFASTVCDILITSAVFKYLWRSQRDIRMRSRPTFIQELATVSINMGTLTCLVSLSVGIVYLVQESQGEHYWVTAPGVVLSRCYINSFLAVLNARRSIRDRERHLYTIEIPTLSAIT
ncbi:hypothetical protein HYDPIDRAFT_30871 [Hydnomerulius pinastri MD-312]|uniref:DUF6534 domain-containing protein n=1 Tax=Hydnomerulius pinastri MD-312 TaxID=994086 RepID=A0A0C9WCE8_9AGAM|nr:hypothetical protein HYDPIDRAFT_30871 [Hydnomerulius pinastri MD-312]